MYTEYQAPTGGNDGEKVTGHRDRDAAVTGSGDEAPPHSRMGRAGQGNLTSRWRRAGRVFQAVQKPYVQRPRGKRAGMLGGSEGRERGDEEGTGGWARPPWPWVCTLRSPALGRAAGRSSTQGVVVKCDALPLFAQRHTCNSERVSALCWPLGQGRRPRALGQRRGPRALRPRRVRRRHVNSSPSPTGGATPGPQAGQGRAFLSAPSSSAGTAALPSRFLPRGS